MMARSTACKLGCMIAVAIIPGLASAGTEMNGRGWLDPQPAPPQRSTLRSDSALRLAAGNRAMQQGGGCVTADGIAVPNGFKRIVSNCRCLPNGVCPMLVCTTPPISDSCRDGQWFRNGVPMPLAPSLRFGAR